MRLYDALENVHLVIPPTLDMEAAKSGLPQHVHELFTTLSETTKRINLSNAAQKSPIYKLPSKQLPQPTPNG
jgi:hypothetical protein